MAHGRRMPATRSCGIVDLADTFHLPVVHFVDCPGFAVGVKHEQAGVTRAGVRAMAAVYQVQTPILPVVIRKAYGLAGSAMFNPTRTRWRYCWPLGRLGLAADGWRYRGGLQAPARRLG